MAPKKKRTIPGTNIPTSSSSKRGKSTLTKAQKQQANREIQRAIREREARENPPDEQGNPRHKGGDVYPGINDKKGKAQGNANPYTRPQKGSAVRRIFDQWGYAYWSDVLLEPDLWKPENREPKRVRNTGYTSISGAIQAADSGGVLGMVRIYRDERGFWHLYFTYGESEDG